MLGLPPVKGFRFRSGAPDNITWHVEEECPVKRPIAALIASSLLLMAPSAFAGGHGWHHGHYWRGYGHHHGDDDDAAYLIGGLLVGGLVTHAYYRSRPVYATPYPSTIVYRETIYPPPPVLISGRRLLRDLEGRCYELQADGQGNELRTELPASACNW
jgi:hypothetical protein